MFKKVTNYFAIVMSGAGFGIAGGAIFAYLFFCSQIFLVAVQNAYQEPSLYNYDIPKYWNFLWWTSLPFGVVVAQWFTMRATGECILDKYIDDPEWVTRHLALILGSVLLCYQYTVHRAGFLSAASLTDLFIELVLVGIAAFTVAQLGLSIEFRVKKH